MKTERGEKSSGYRAVGCMYICGLKAWRFWKGSAVRLPLGGFQACEVEAIMQQIEIQ